MCVPYVRAAQLSHVELLHLLFNLTTLWSIGDFEARDGFAAKGGAAYYVQISIILLLLSGVVSTFSIYSRQHTADSIRKPIFGGLKHRPTDGMPLNVSVSKSL